MFVSTPFLSQIHATSWLCNQGPRYYILWPVLHSRFLATTFYSAHSSLIGGSILLIEYLMGHIGFQIPPLRHSIFFACPNLPQILGPPAAFPVNFQVARGRRRSEQPAHFGQATPRGPNIQRQIGGWWRIIGISKTPQYIHIYIFQYQIPHDSSQKKQNMNRGSTKPGILAGYCHVFSWEELISIGVRRVWLHPLPDRTIMQNIEFCLKTHGES